MMKTKALCLLMEVAYGFSIDLAVQACPAQHKKEPVLLLAHLLWFESVLTVVVFLLKRSSAFLAQLETNTAVSYKCF